MGEVMWKESQLAARAFDVVEAVATTGPCSLSVVAERTQIAFSTVHRVAQFLIDRGYLIAVKRGSYCLGPAALRLTSSLSFHDMLSTVARPILESLARACRAPAHLGIFDGDMVTYLIKIPYGRSNLFSVEGMQLEAYCSAIGKVLLAHQPADQIEHYLARGEFVALTPNTIVEPDALGHALKQVRTQGWALDDEEILPGLRCLATPILDANAGAVAAISVSFPSLSLDRRDITRALATISDAAARIRDKLRPGLDRPRGIVPAPT
jgi:IclR family acetate operon transcriptional repressor